MPISTSFRWTETTTAEGRKLWLGGLSAAQIGAKLGITRNAVIGRAHRCGWPPRAAGGGRPARSEPNPKPVTRIRLSTSRNMGRPKQVLAAPPIEFDGVVAPKSLLEITTGECHYMVQDSPPMFCARLVAAGSFCAAHGRLVYQPSPRSSRSRNAVRRY